jgi:hypothetical protein
LQQSSTQLHRLWPRLGCRAFTSCIHGPEVHQKSTAAGRGDTFSVALNGQLMHPRYYARARDASSVRNIHGIVARIVGKVRRISSHSHAAINISPTSVLAIVSWSTYLQDVLTIPRQPPVSRTTQYVWPPLQMGGN